MRRKTRASVKVLRWKASGPPSGAAADLSPGPMELVQQELPLKENTAGLRVITVILAVMLLHVLFIGGIALYNLLGGSGKASQSGGARQKAPAVAEAAGTTPAGKRSEEAAVTTLAASASNARRGRAKAQADASSSSSTAATERTKGSKKRFRRVAVKENREEAAALEAALPAPQRTGEARGGAETVSLAPPQGESTDPALSAAGSSRIYHVVRGDTLWRIARRFHVGLDELMTVNRLTPASKLHIGQRLQIPAAKAGRARRTGGATDG